ncbi:hypothetical protein [Mycobacteroides chelonae]|uniref:hypothetical protein n=1 Tax=Mycobacteroides chelonae TaxID=1774 RepID=UPI0010423402|nr:hypothetical protein [Mycobacteroides chelonae]
MTGLTHPADEARIREIVREELARLPLQFPYPQFEQGDCGVRVRELGLKGQECLRNLRKYDELRLKVDALLPSFAESVEHTLNQRLGDRQFLKGFVGFWVIQKLQRLVSHRSSPSSVGSTPTVGETAAPGGELRAQTSGAANSGGCAVSAGKNRIPGAKQDGDS